MKKHVFITFSDVLLACTPKFPFHYLQKQTKEQLWSHLEESKDKISFFKKSVSLVIGTIDGMSEQLH